VFHNAEERLRFVILRVARYNLVDPDNPKSERFVTRNHSNQILHILHRFDLFVYNFLTFCFYNTQVTHMSRCLAVFSNKGGLGLERRGPSHLKWSVPIRAKERNQDRDSSARRVEVCGSREGKGGVADTKTGTNRFVSAAPGSSRSNESNDSSESARGLGLGVWRGAGMGVETCVVIETLR
jgi:hypothetical protein